MVSWGYALGRGLDAFGLVIIWQLLGFLIATGVSGGALFSILQNPPGAGTTFAQSLVAIVVGYLIGGIIASIGSYATLIKISVESAQELQIVEEAGEEGENASLDHWTKGDNHLREQSRSSETL